VSYLRHIRACNAPVTEPFLPWYIDGRVHGWIRPAFADHLADWPDLFERRDEALHTPSAQVPELTGRLAEVARELAARGVVTALLDEPYPITAGGREQTIATVDRVLAAPLGLRSFGQHLNGYVRDGGHILMWIGRRARDRLIFPGALDQLVAGGLPHGVDLWDNLVKECAEEAGMPEALARRARPVGALTYNRVAERGFRPDVLYCYDLELPGDFVPRNTDGEVEEFLLLPLEEVARIVRETDEFKLNCNLVIIDFLVRHGVIGPDDPDYLAIVTGLHPAVGMPETSRGL
jgi:8-oxo-dGTP pyrophosphatase MutT (NUDIX family)